MIILITWNVNLYIEFMRFLIRFQLKNNLIIKLPKVNTSEWLKGDGRVRRTFYWLNRNWWTKVFYEALAMLIQKTSRKRGVHVLVFVLWPLAFCLIWAILGFWVVFARVKICLLKSLKLYKTWFTGKIT